MPATYSKRVDEATDTVVSLIDKAQETTTSVVSTVAESVADYVPDLGLGEMLLSPAEAVETGYRVTDRFLDAGRRFTLGLIEAVSPVTDKVFGAAKPPVKAAKSA